MAKSIITISREFGSGGRTIGRKVAETLGIPFYDRELIEMSAEQGGFAADFVQNTEQKVKSKFFHSLAFGYMNSGLGSGAASLSDRLFAVTSDIIRKLAAEGPCVIVGRCADYVLSERQDVLDVFIYSDLAHKVRRAVTEYGLDPDKAEAEVKKTDKYRANHYDYYTDRTWGAKENYHLMIDSGELGIDAAANLIVAAYNAGK